MSQIRIGGVDIEYYDDDFRDPWSREDGVPLLMLHGFAENASVWIPWVPGLSKKYRVLRYSMRGCGKSSMPPDKSWSGEAIVKESLDLLNALKVQQVHFIGSMSGAVFGQLFALTYPDRIKSLTLLDGPSKIPDELIKRYSLDQTDPATAIEKYGLVEWSKRTLHIRIDITVGDPRIVEWYHKQKSGGPTEVGAAIMRTAQVADLRPMLKNIKCPVLILTGDRNALTPAEDLRVQEREIPNAKLIIFENLGSGCRFLMTDRCVEEVLKFYESIG